MKLIPVISPNGEFINPDTIVTASRVFYGGEKCTDRAEVITTDGKHFIVSLRAIDQSGLFDEPSANQSPASSDSVGFKPTNTLNKSEYDALRKRVEKLEEINKEQSERIKGLMDRALIGVYKADFDRAIVQRDAAREELKNALNSISVLAKDLDDCNRLVKHVTIQREDYRHAADAYKVRIDQIQGIVNP